MSEYEFLRWEIGDSGMATVWLSRAPVNAINQPMYGEIQRLFGELGADPAVNAIVLAGDGRHFCAGNELAEFETMTPENAGERMLNVREAFWAIYDCAVPVIAAVQGTAVGTGLAIVASCDMAIAAEGRTAGGHRDHGGCDGRRQAPVATDAAIDGPLDVLQRRSTAGGGVRAVRRGARGRPAR